MSGKHLGLAVALTALLGIVYLFGPILVILVASLLGAGSGGGAHSENIGSGQNLNVKKIVTPHRSWNTGSAFEVTAYDVLHNPLRALCTLLPKTSFHAPGSAAEVQRVVSVCFGALADVQGRSLDAKKTPRS